MYFYLFILLVVYCAIFCNELFYIFMQKYEQVMMKSCFLLLFFFNALNNTMITVLFLLHFPPQSKNRPHLRGEYNVYSTFQSHEPEFDYLKSLEIEEKINKIRWLPQQNAAHFLLSTNGKSFFLFFLFADNEALCSLS